MLHIFNLDLPFLKTENLDRWERLAVADSIQAIQTILNFMFEM